ncbi:hypothetical protein CYMTET_22698 [Cymbomonas tetramitiformis]|uniref:Uncharacterized protein n=1 Tax=Cymbomonas tetramitiformis TaxID=36881 RepID=A0AAE0L208_9CHLO|nr:hypothetical protein CYMTET_22698 [Cymbomonas tetramitiformis]
MLTDDRLALAVMAMREHVNNEGIAEAGLGLLQIMALTDEGQASLLEHNAVQVAVAAMRDHPDQETICDTGLGFMQIVTSGSVEGCGAALAQDIIPLVSDMLTHYVHNSGIQEGGLGLLRNLIDRGYGPNDQALRATLQRDAYEMAMNALRVFPDHEGVQEVGLQLLQVS